MNHYRLYKNLNVQPFLEEINLNDDWRKAVGRGIYMRQGERYDRIDLIKGFRNPGDPESKPLSELCIDVNTPTVHSTYTGVIPTKVFPKYKIVSAFLNWFKETYNAKIARVRYIKIPSGCSIGLHIDGGPYFQKTHRFHLVLQSEYQYTVNGEMQEYKEGELWWFNNKELHGTYIHGSKDRIAMIFDCKCDMERIINDLE